MSRAEPVRLFLVRHGTTAANRELRFIGGRDDELAAEGRRQAGHLALALAGLGLDAVFASPARRALDTAEPIAEAAGLVVTPEPRLREISFGDWEGMTRGEVLAEPAARELLARWEADPEASPPGGDSFAAAQRRMLELADELAAAHRGRQLVLVSHVGPIKALLYAALGAPLVESRRLFLDPATVSVVDWGERPVVRVVNGYGHLGPQGARWMQG